MRWYGQVKTAMTASEAIGKLRQLREEMAKKVADFEKDVASAESQWEHLGRVGGQREESAAAILSSLLPGLRGVTAFASACEEQINKMRAENRLAGSSVESNGSFERKGGSSQFLPS